MYYINIVAIKDIIILEKIKEKKKVSKSFTDITALAKGA